jgi:hypothetical protein
VLASPVEDSVVVSPRCLRVGWITVVVSSGSLDSSLFCRCLRLRHSLQPSSPHSFVDSVTFVVWPSYSPSSFVLVVRVVVDSRGVTMWFSLEFRAFCIVRWMVWGYIFWI